jgi:hypothetical protein
MPAAHRATAHFDAFESRLPDERAVGEDPHIFRAAAGEDRRDIGRIVGVGVDEAIGRRSGVVDLAQRQRHEFRGEGQRSIFTRHHAGSHS